MRLVLSCRNMILFVREDDTEYSLPTVYVKQNCSPTYAAQQASEDLVKFKSKPQDLERISAKTTDNHGGSIWTYAANVPDRHYSRMNGRQVSIDQIWVPYHEVLNFAAAPSGNKKFNMNDLDSDVLRHVKKCATSTRTIDLTAMMTGQY